MPDCIAIIPAKGTSTRIPRKNLALCAGKSLVARAVECAFASGIFCHVWVSTEDNDIMVEARRAGRASGNVPWIHRRLPLLSAEGVPVAAVVPFVLSAYQGGNPAIRIPLPESFCVLWPTSPLRTPEMLQRMWEFFTRGFDSLYSTSERTRQHEGTAIFMRTQFFLTRLSLDFRLGDPYFVIPDQDVCDVNTPEDLAEAERRLLAREAQCPSS